MAKRDASETPSIQSLGRGLSILEAVAESPEPVPLKQLTDLLGIDRSSVFRLANTLRRRRFLANPKGRKDYILGPLGVAAVAQVRTEHVHPALPRAPAPARDQDRRNRAPRGA